MKDVIRLMVFLVLLIETSIIKKLFKEEPSPYSLQLGSPLACVVDQQGNGVAGATVTFKAYLRYDCDRNPIKEAPDWQGMSVATNEKGEFTFPPELRVYKEADKDNSVHADIEAEGFLPRKGVRVCINYADDLGYIDLFRIGRIEGALIAPDGDPGGNAPVYLSTGIRYQNPSSSCHGCFSANVKTDEAGLFVFEKVPAGIHFVKFPGHAGGCKPDESEPVPYK
ncbi:MAG: carboxypeptidase-like regulatory domain-containing protein, partial [Planctomycetota bacterium]